MNGFREMLRCQTLVALLLLSASSCAQEPTAPTSPVAAVADSPLSLVALSYRVSGDGRSDKAIEAAQHLVRTHPNQAASYLALTRALVEKKRESGDPMLLAFASDALRAAESLEPAAPAALALRGVLLQEDHKFSQLADVARTLIKGAPNDSTGHLLLGDAELELGNYEAAVVAYEHAMDLYPDLRVYSRASHLRWLHGDVAGAFELMDAALESAGNNREHLAWCLTDAGALFLRLGQADKAIAAADRAAHLVPGYPGASSLRARAHYSLSNHQAAAKAIHAALAARASAEDYFLLADIEEARGNSSARSEAEAKGLALAAHDPLPAAMHLAKRGDQPDRALTLAEAVAAERPTVAAMAAVALASHRAGNHDQADAHIERALRLGTPLAELHLTAGLIKLARGDRSGARASLNQARRLNPNADRHLTNELRSSLEVVR